MAIDNIEKRSLFDWVIFALVHLVVIGGIGFAGFWVYGVGLGFWVAVSATVAGLALTYLHAMIVPGETLMKVLIYLFAALNAGYLVHNGARAMGVESYNEAQVKKYEAGMAQAAKATSVRVARTLGSSNEYATRIAKVFNDDVATFASILAFLEFFTALVALSLASRRSSAVAASPSPVNSFAEAESEDEFEFNGSNLPKAQR